MARLLLAGMAWMTLTVAAGPLLADGGAPCESCGDGHGATRGGFQQFWHRCAADFHRNNSWPEPFHSADKIATRTPYCIMTDNGWKMQNTVGTFLFDTETQRVNQAGELLVKWIVTQAPVSRRAVFVLKGDSPEATAARVESVQVAVAKYADGCVCPVLLTNTEPAGWSAAYIDTITQQFNATIPAPRLPPRQGGDGSGAGGGGGASQ